MSPLEKAQKELKILTVSLFKSSVEMAEEQLTKNDDETTNLISQSFHGCSKIQEVLVEDNEKSEAYSYFFYFDAGIRLINEDDENKEEILPQVEIQATLIAKYISMDKLEEQIIKAFAENNAGFNVWPYWREYVHNTCSRIGIKQIEVPLYSCKNN